MNRELSFKNFGFKYESTDKPAFDQFNLVFNSAGCLSVLGHNGSGKSTFLKLLSGIISGDDGKILGDASWGASSLVGMSSRQRSQIVGYAGSDLKLEFGLSVREMIEMGFYSRGPVRSESVDSIVVSLGLESFLKRDIRTLSGGERQRVLLARSMILDPQVLILDETLSKMDLENQLDIGLLLKKWSSNKLVILVSHDLNFILNWADDLLLMKQGQVLNFGKTEITGTPEILSQLYPKKEMNWIQDPQTRRFQISCRFE